MGNANSGNVRERHKSGESLPPSSPAGGAGIKDGGAFSFDKRPSVGSTCSSSSSHPLGITTTSSSVSNPSSPLVIGAPAVGSGGSSSSSRQGILLQHSQSNEDDQGPLFTHHHHAKSLTKYSSSSEDYPETGVRPRALTLSEGTRVTSPDHHYHHHGLSSPKILPTVFKWDGGGKAAFICGTFSDWKTIPMVKSNFTAKDGEDFIAIVDLPEGEHQYKFLIDSEWKCNPAEPTVATEDGTINNIIRVRKTDFEVFDALAMDQCNSKSSKATQLLSGSPPGSEWAQDVPSYKPWEKTTGPPILPPHLLQVILNKDTPLSCEPTLLPEPNHVMLNHLYALSIKDGVMVLSATHRYRKKYVTTLLYKPI